MGKAGTPYHPYKINQLKDPKYAVMYIRTVCEQTEDDQELTEEEFEGLVTDAIADIVEAYGGNHAAFRTPMQLGEIEKRRDD